MHILMPALGNSMRCSRYEEIRVESGVQVSAWDRKGEVHYNRALRVHKLSWRH